ncbi:MAG: TldD/PmbA family protein [Candidatus Thorarchaeota archaeon]
MKDGKDLAEFCVEYGRGLGASYVEARFEKKFAKGLAYRNGEPISGGMTPSSGIGVRLLVNGNMGFASFDGLEKESAKSAIDAAIKMAKSAKRKDPIDLGEPVSNKAKWKMPVKESLLDVDIDTLMATADDLNKQMEGLVSYTMMLNPSVTEKFIITSEGSEVEGLLSFLSIYTIISAKGKIGPEQRFVNLTQTGGWERIKEGHMVETLARAVESLKKTAMNAEKLDYLLDQPVDFIVGSEVAGIIAHENVGHPSEGDRIMGREGAQAGESFWRDLKLGESRVGSEHVNVSEDPTIPFTTGFYLYDDECVKARNRVLIKEGIINEPLLNREFGVKFGIGTNAASRSTGYDREPIIRMANTFFEPGDFTLDELVEDVKLGIYMRSFNEWNIDDRRYQSKYTGSEAYVIKNGEITETMVKAPVFETTSVGMLSAVDGISNERKLDFPATCGKSEPSQGIPVNAGGGEIRFRAIRLGGVG